MTPNVIGDCSVDVRTSDPLGACANDLSARDDRDIRRAAADVHDCRSMRIVGADARSESCRQTFFNHPDATNMCVLRRTQQGTSLNWSDVRKDTHQGAATEM